MLRQRLTTQWVFASLLGVASLGLPAVGCGDDEAAPASTPDAASSTPPDTSTPNQTTPDASSPTVDSGSTGTDSGSSESTCTTTITSGQGGTFVELCKLDQGTVQHVVVRGVLTPATHAVAELYFGFDTAPDAVTTTNANATFGADQLRVLLYGGGTPFPPGIIQPTYGTKVKAFPGDASFLRSLTTVCFDVGDGSASTGPAIALWVEGQNGANCSDKATLTKTNTFGSRTDWESAVGAIAKGKKIFFWQSASLTDLPTITLSSKPAISDL